MESTFDYVKKTSCYILLAQLYDKLYGGLIPHNFMSCPTDLTSEYGMEKYLNKNISTQKLEKAIDEYITRNKIKKYIYECLKNSADLRYLIFGGFHDALIEDFFKDSNRAFIKINYENCNIVLKNNMHKCQIFFEDIDSIKCNQEICGLYIDSLRIYFEPTDQIKLSMLCHSHGNVFTEEECSIFCKNIHLLFD